MATYPVDCIEFNIIIYVYHKAISSKNIIKLHTKSLKKLTKKAVSYALICYIQNELNLGSQ